jgi:hypothetical protein
MTLPPARCRLDSRQWRRDIALRNLCPPRRSDRVNGGQGVRRRTTDDELPVCYLQGWRFHAIPLITAGRVDTALRPGPLSLEGHQSQSHGFPSPRAEPTGCCAGNRPRGFHFITQLTAGRAGIRQRGCTARDLAQQDWRRRGRLPRAVPGACLTQGRRIRHLSEEARLFAGYTGKERKAFLLS